MPIRVSETNNLREQFEAAVFRLGGDTAARAFARAVNHETRKAQTKVLRTIRAESGIRSGDVRKAVRFHRASPQSLTAALIATGKPFALKYFGAKQFSYGVRARPWGRSQRFPGAFIVASKGGDVFTRVGSARLPIQRLWGPAVPNEMIREKPVNEFNRATDAIADRAAHEAQRILEGRG